MRDWRAFEGLLDRILKGGDPVPDGAWAPFRDRAAVLITDLSGFTRLTRELGLPRMVALLHGMRQTALPLLKACGGTLVKYEADDLFAAFKNPAEALRCAVALRESFRNAGPELMGSVALCMGIGFGEILWWGERDLYGEEVNLASKLGEDTAGPGEILLTGAAVEAIRAVEPRVSFAGPESLEVGGKVYSYYIYEKGLEL